MDKKTERRIARLGWLSLAYTWGPWIIALVGLIMGQLFMEHPFLEPR